MLSIYGAPITLLCCWQGPGSTVSCLDESTLLACMAKGALTLPKDCGCVNGNEGMRLLSEQIRKMGFKWGSYSKLPAMLSVGFRT